MIFSVSVDLDGLGCYAAIHGLAASKLPEKALRAVPEVALSRFCELFADEKIAGTFFAIGRELELPGAAAALGLAARAGHEVGSHSFSHDYALSRLSPAEIAFDLARAETAIWSATGARPCGFRAPGYTLSKALLSAVRERGYLYDSSLMPSLPYYLAKAAAVGLYGLRGRKSQSILGPVGQLFGSRGPHLREGVRELPVATLPLLRGPVIGTVVLGVSEPVAAGLLRLGEARGHLNLELHGIDLLDSTDAGAPELAGAQPGLALPVREKLGRLRALLRRLGARGEACTLKSAALRFWPEARP